MGHATDPVEVALADALNRAARAEQWDVVGRLADERQARRRAHMDVAALEAERAKQDDKR